MEFLARFSDLWSNLVEKVVNWGESFVKMLPNLVIAILVVAAAWFVARGLSNLLDRQLERYSQQEQLRHLIVRIVRFAVLFGGGVIALGVLSLDKTVTSILAGVGILGLALGFAFQDIASNFMSGIVLIFRKPFRTGDLIESGSFFGRIEQINIRDTVGRTSDGLLVVIPNTLLLNQPLTNYTGNDMRRVDLVCGVSYGDDLQNVEQVAIAAVETIEERIAERDVELFYEEFGGSSINFKVRFWVPAEQKVYLTARSKAIKAIKTAFAQNSITIPFPVRTLDFGIVGGRHLSEELAETKAHMGN